MGFLSTVNINEQPDEPKRASGSDFRPMQFLLKGEEKAKVIFLSGVESALTIKAHSLWGLEKFPVFIPCKRPVGSECEFCQHAEGITDEKKRWGFLANTFYIFSLADLRPYEREKDGVKVMIPCSRKVLMIRHDQVKKYLNPIYQNVYDLYEKDLPGTLAMVFRSKVPEKGPKPPAFGDSWQTSTFLKGKEDWKDEWKIKDSEGNLQIPQPFSEEEIMKIFVTDEDQQQAYLRQLSGEGRAPQKDWNDSDE